MPKTVMVFAAHPDDEILGVGGTIRKLIIEGASVISVILAHGRKEEQKRISTCIEEANRQIGVSQVIFLGLPNLEMETIPLYTINQEIEKLLRTYTPEMVFTHHYGDLNKDHQITFQAVFTSCRPLPGYSPAELLCFETPSSTEWMAPFPEQSFKPNFFVNISETLSEKLRALRHYQIEMRLYPHPRSYEGVKHLAAVRGITIGVPHAEAFEVIRRIWK
ncbi:N-acetylglucosaminyl deacetylase, LmbE family [Paenibacillus sp. UNCCL117]|uniref:PIG-L deacetylase family protein n=1 Tax=unclassified Paenibacillus TaxID=185978 RepID=UPI00088B7FDD|nr:MULTISPECIES: PIG-L deacetylase family protein [unclassified Paenibacillus]SDC55437.1 N-acetylglucosaminyl deacetylase, LmbE family [Paenibacillus sp. cl123]SFW10931.1 N-acetylglucosaminyl deacetylase, LmbE family [Paenibacillus sp. UNCCL117]